MTTSSLWPQLQSALGLVPDGIAGPKTLAALAPYLGFCPVSWKALQQKLLLSADGIPGPQTAAAVWKALSLLTDSPLSLLKEGKMAWPKENQVESFFGAPGEGLQLLELPYPMVLSWDKTQRVSKMTCHSLVAPSLKRLLAKTLAFYGESEIKRLFLDQFGGCFNNRTKVGGSTKSMHAYGIAVDLYPQGNDLKWNHQKAVFARPEYEAFWSFVEEEGALSLGRRYDYDWMHFQFTAA